MHPSFLVSKTRTFDLWRLSLVLINEWSIARFVGVLLLGHATVCNGQLARDKATLVVGVKPAAPFVIVNENSEKISGFSIDLINAVAAQMTPPRSVEFVVHDDLTEHLGAVSRGDVDLGISATSYTSERERTLDFSIPFFQGGLGIATQAKGSGFQIWDALKSRQLHLAIFWVAIFLAICANTIWFIERGRGNTFDDRWLVGLGQAMWWTVVTMTTVGYGDFAPSKPLTRFVGVLVIITGIILFGIAVGSLTSALTVKQINSNIRTPNDLRNRPVAVVSDTIAESTLKERGMQLVKKDTLEAALSAVANGEVVAAVHDIALLRYHVPRNAPTLAIVGPTFAEQGYGITFPVGSDIRKDVNLALLKLMESDPPRYQWMLDNWFGAP